MERHRIFYVLDSLEEDEVGDQVITLLERLPRSRFEPRVVGLGPHGALGSRIRQMSVMVHRMDLTGLVGTVMAVPRMRRVLRGLRADIVHTFQPWSDTVVQLAAPRTSTIFRSVRGHSLLHPKSLDEGFRGWIERRTARLRERRFVVPDELALETVRTHYKVDNVDVVPECVDLGAVRERARQLSPSDARLRLGLREGDRAVATFSDFLDARRLERLLEGFAMARIERPGLRLFLVGDGPQEGAAKWYAESLHLEDGVVFLGGTTDRVGLLRTCEAVVDAGSFPGWSRGAVEAMSMELPVLRWVDEGDWSGVGRFKVRISAPPERFAKDLMAVLRDGAQRDPAIKAAVQEVQAFDVATVADRWSELYVATS